jgi:hypothetical protein
VISERLLGSRLGRGRGAVPGYPYRDFLFEVGE